MAKTRDESEQKRNKIIDVENDEIMVIIIHNITLGYGSQKSDRECVSR
jgi:hypothetical protein